MVTRSKKTADRKIKKPRVIDLQIKAKLLMPIVPLPSPAQSLTTLQAGICKKRKGKPPVQLHITGEGVHLVLTGIENKTINMPIHSIVDITTVECKSGLALTYMRDDGKYVCIALKLKSVKRNSIFSRKRKVTGAKIREVVVNLQEVAKKKQSSTVTQKETVSQSIVSILGKRHCRRLSASTSSLSGQKKVKLIEDKQSPSTTSLCKSLPSPFVFSGQPVNQEAPSILGKRQCRLLSPSTSTSSLSTVPKKLKIDEDEQSLSSISRSADSFCHSVPSDFLFSGIPSGVEAFNEHLVNKAPHNMWPDDIYAEASKIGKRELRDHSHAFDPSTSSLESGTPSWNSLPPLNEESDNYPFPPSGYNSYNTGSGSRFLPMFANSTAQPAYYGEQAYPPQQYDSNSGYYYDHREQVAIPNYYAPADFDSCNSYYGAFPHNSTQAYYGEHNYTNSNNSHTFSQTDDLRNEISYNVEGMFPNSSFMPDPVTTLSVDDKDRSCLSTDYITVHSTKDSAIFQKTIFSSTMDDSTGELKATAKVATVYLHKVGTTVQASTNVATLEASADLNMETVNATTNLDSKNFIAY